MRKAAQTEQDVLPIVGQCLEGIQRCTDSINEKEVFSIYKKKLVNNALCCLDIWSFLN